MSRVERNIEKRYKRKRMRFILKIVFILTMIIATGICLIVIDFNANNMLGNKSFIERSIESIKSLELYIK